MTKQLDFGKSLRDVVCDSGHCQTLLSLLNGILMLICTALPLQRKLTRVTPSDPPPPKPPKKPFCKSILHSFRCFLPEYSWGFPSQNIFFVLSEAHPKLEKIHFWTAIVLYLYIKKYAVVFNDDQSILPFLE